MVWVNLPTEIWCTIFDDIPIESLHSLYIATKNHPSKKAIVTAIGYLKHVSFGKISTKDFISFLKDLQSDLARDDACQSKSSIEQIHEMPLEVKYLDQLVDSLALFAPRVKRITYDWVKYDRCPDELIYKFALEYAKKVVQLGYPCLLDCVQFRDFSTGGRSKASGMSEACIQLQRQTLHFAPKFKINWLISGAVEIPATCHKSVAHLMIIGLMSGNFQWTELSNLKELTLRCVPSSDVEEILGKVSHQLTKISFLLVDHQFIKAFKWNSFSWNSLTSIKFTISDKCSMQLLADLVINLPNQIRELWVVSKNCRHNALAFLFFLFKCKKQLDLTFLQVTGFRLYNIRYMRNKNYRGECGTLKLSPCELRDIGAVVELFKEVKKVDMSTSEPPSANRIEKWKAEASTLGFNLVVNQVPISK